MKINITQRAPILMMVVYWAAIAYVFACMFIMEQEPETFMVHATSALAVFITWSVLLFVTSWVEGTKKSGRWKNQG